MEVSYCTLLPMVAGLVAPALSSSSQQVSFVMQQK